MTQTGDERAAVAGAIATVLAAFTLSPLVAGGTWLIVTAVTVLGVMICGIAARSVLRWWPLVALAQFVVLALTVTVLFARGTAFAGVIPGPAAIQRFRDLIEGGLAVSRDQPPPVDMDQGVVLMLVGGIGLVAVAVDLLAATLRQPALAGLPLLAVYCVPAALLPGGLPWYYFVAAAAGFLLLLSADAGDRVRAWGRVLTSAGGSRAIRRSSEDGVSGFARGGRRVGAVVVIVAALVPALVPGLGDRMLGAGEGGENGDGDGATIRTINPIVNLRQDLNRGNDDTLITYRSPQTSPEPLRIVTADVYDGSTWAPGRAAIPRRNKVQEGLPKPPGLEDSVPTRSIVTRIEIGNLNQSYLPLPYPAQRVDVEGRWLYDAQTLNVVGQGEDTRGLSYAVTSLQLDPTPQQLAEAGSAPQALDNWTQLPKDLPAVIGQIASQVAGEGSDYEQAVRLQRFFRSEGNFRYDTQAPQAENGDGSVDAIELFLRERRGYCVHFASAMAVMARTLDIPARVGVGFLPGSTSGDGDRRISAQDAHAWPELYFQGVGWVRFEPTPGTRTGEAPEWSTPPSGLLPEDEAPSAQAPATSAAPASPQQARPQTPEDLAPTTTEPTLADRIADLPWRVIGVVALIVLVALAPLTAARLARRRRWRAATTGAARVEAAWEELRLRLSDLGIRWAASWTPRALQHRLTGDLELGGEEQAALGRLVADLEAARYAPPQDAPGRSRSALTADVSTVVTAASADLGARDRWRARIFPTSGLRTLRDAARHADEAGARVTSGLHLPHRTTRDKDRDKDREREKEPV